jgi:general secretion pathway protein M
MSIATTFAQYRERATALWLARTEQERRFLAIGGAVVLAALLYLLLVDPAIEGRAQLRRQLPQLRQQAAELQAMAQEAATLDEQRRANRLLVQDAVVTSLPAAGQVDASLTLRQNTGSGQ